MTYMQFHIPSELFYKVNSVFLPLYLEIVTNKDETVAAVITL